MLQVTFFLTIQFSSRTSQVTPLSSITTLPSHHQLNNSITTHSLTHSLTNSHHQPNLSTPHHIQQATTMAPKKDFSSSTTGATNDDTTTTKLTPAQSSSLILNYLQQQNRPYSAIDISANLKNRVTKTAAAKLLKDLHERGEIEGRVAGKGVVYHALQVSMPPNLPMLHCVVVVNGQDAYQCHSMDADEV
jgi:hypothetical protein